MDFNYLVLWKLRLWAKKWFYSSRCAVGLFSGRFLSQNGLVTGKSISLSYLWLKGFSESLHHLFLSLKLSTTSSWWYRIFNFNILLQLRKYCYLTVNWVLRERKSHKVVFHCTVHILHYLCTLISSRLFSNYVSQ